MQEKIEFYSNHRPGKIHEKLYYTANKVQIEYSNHLNTFWVDDQKAQCKNEKVYIPTLNMYDKFGLRLIIRFTFKEKCYEWMADGYDDGQIYLRTSDGVTIKFKQNQLKNNINAKNHLTNLFGFKIANQLKITTNEVLDPQLHNKLMDYIEGESLKPLLIEKKKIRFSLTAYISAIIVLLSASLVCLFFKSLILIDNTKQALIQNFKKVDNFLTKYPVTSSVLPFIASLILTTIAFYLTIKVGSIFEDIMKNDTLKHISNDEFDNCNTKFSHKVIENNKSTKNIKLIVARYYCVDNKNYISSVFSLRYYIHIYVIAIILTIPLFHCLKSNLSSNDNTPKAKINVIVNYVALSLTLIAAIALLLTYDNYRSKAFNHISDLTDTKEALFNDNTKKETDKELDDLITFNESEVYINNPNVDNCHFAYGANTSPPPSYS